MTREEAIKLLTQYIDYDAEMPDYYKMEEACKVAIKALEQEPCEDCISRKEALVMFNQWILSGEYKKSESNLHLLDRINNLPSIQPKPKIGHWKVQPSNEEQGERPFIWWKCSECGQVIYSETEHDRREYHAYCGRCGAKMAENEDKNGKNNSNKAH